MTQTAEGRRLLLVGGGHAHVHVLRSFGLAPQPGLRLTLVTKDIETPYSGMLPGLIAGHYRHEECHIDLRRLARFAGAQLIHAEAVGVDSRAKQVLLSSLAAVPYDILSLDIGSTARLPSANAERFLVPIRPVARFLEWLPEVEARAARTPKLKMVIVGGGVGGVELLLSLQHRLSGIGETAPEWTLLTRGPLLRAKNKRTQQAFARILRERGVRVQENAGAVAVEAGSIRLADGSAVAFDEAVWVTGAGSPKWLEETGLELADGFVAVDRCLRARNEGSIFAAGDVATMVDDPRPKAGVFAVRQGPALAENLRRALADRPLRPHLPQRRFLSLVGTGDHSAVADWGPFSAEGRWVWQLKEWIDRRWMAKYQQLPAASAHIRSGEAGGG
jgi:selenide,water dikinase